jgi:hypothetical protein
MEQTQIRPYQPTFWQPATVSAQSSVCTAGLSGASGTGSAHTFPRQQTHAHKANSRPQEAHFQTGQSFRTVRRGPKPTMMLARASRKLLLCSGRRQFDINSEMEAPRPLSRAVHFHTAVMRRTSGWSLGTFQQTRALSLSHVQ